MSLWDKTENVAITGVSITTEGVVTVSGVADLRTALKVGDVLTSGAETYTIATVTETQATVSETVSAAVTTQTVYKKVVPSWIKDPAYAATVSLVSTDEATSEGFRANGIKSPGWTRSITYTDQNDNERVKNETLVFMRNDDTPPA